jgi:hypothetical protein
MLCSPGGVADLLKWNWVSSGKAQVGRSLWFCVHVLWQVLDVPDACSTHSVVLFLCLCFSKSGEMK